MKSLRKIWGISILIALLLTACLRVPSPPSDLSADVQGLVETGIAQTAQISQLETAAADNGGQQDQDQTQAEAPQEVGGETGSSESELFIVAVNSKEDAQVPSSGLVAITLAWAATTPEYAADWLNAIQMEFYVDGGKQANPMAYWSEINADDLDNDGTNEYIVRWNYPIGQLSPGNHMVVLTLTYTRAVLDGYDSDGDGELDIYDGVKTYTRMLIVSEAGNQSFTGSASPQFTASQDTNCRYGPSTTNFDIQRTVFKGQSVTIVGKGNAPAQGWWVVQVDSAQCWVWGDLGASSGNTNNVPGINPPAAPAAPQPEQNGGNDQPADACQDINQPVVTVDPTAGYRPQIFTFTITGFLPNSTERLAIYLNTDRNNLLYGTTLNTDGNGNATIKVNSGDIDNGWDIWGEYFVAVFGDCENEYADAVFLILIHA